MNRFSIISYFCAVLLFLYFKLDAQTCYELIWGDEFNYSGLPDSSKWSNEVGGNGWGNNELQYYTNERLENARVEDGNLIIEARKENFGGRSYTSARLITYHNQHSWKYGKVEARMKLPRGQGIWPAFWMLGDGIFNDISWPACGEIDIMEMIGGGEGKDDKTYGTIHWADANNNHAEYGGSVQLTEGIFADSFHVFTIEWTPTTIKWFLDDFRFHIVDITPATLNEFHNKFFIILNLAVGGNWPGSPDASTVFPQQLIVDYVRVYQQNTVPNIVGDSIVSKAEKNLRYSLVESQGFTYNWSVHPDAVIIDGQGTNSILVDWGCSEGNVSCEVTAACSTYTVEQFVAFENLSITGKGFIETNEENLSFSVPLSREANYEWKFPEGVHHSSQPDSNVAIAQWNSSDGQIMVKVNNYCGADSTSKYIVIQEQLPYPDPGQPHIIPGEIEAINYDFGGEGIAYHDFESENLGPGSRQDEGVDTEPNDGGENIGWIVAGEWLEYSVQVEETGTYDLEIRTASISNTGSFKILFNGEERTSSISVPNTGAWTSFTTTTIPEIQLYSSDTLMRLYFEKGEFNIGRLLFTDSKLNSAESTQTENSLKIYPTIATNELIIENNYPGQTYTIYDISGRKIDVGVLYTHNNIYVRNLKPGTYYIVLNSLKNAAISKLFFKL